jgi:hypothetical protein
MPSRIKLDRALIFAAIEKHGSPKRAAESLGIHYNTALQVDRLRRGLCMRCGQKPMIPGQSKCPECSETERVRMAQKRKTARSKHQCSMCPKPLKKGSTLYCAEHYEQTYKRQQHFRFLDRFGPHAAEVWRAAGCICRLCGKAHSEQTLHIHHIDEDDTNGAVDNLIVICRDCHWITHRLLESRNRVALIAWFERTYPDKPLRQVHQGPTALHSGAPTAV